MGLFAEGVAIGRLVELARLAPVTVTLTREITRENAREVAASFQSLFHIAAVRAASSVVDSRGENVRGLLWQQIWDLIRLGGGVVGSGSAIYFVSVDPAYVVPSVFRGSARGFPLRSAFRRSLIGAFQQLGRFDDDFSEQEEALITFLFEAAHNSYEHGRTVPIGAELRGARGISAHKLSIANDKDVDSRGDLPDPVRRYVRATLPSTPRRLFMCCTVADAGAGIHHTSPVGSDSSAWGRLAHAFRPGISRKPQSGEIALGLGLQNLLVAAFELQAFLFVRSAELMAYIDFTEVSETFDGTDVGPLLRHWPAAVSPGSVGTVLSVLWPVQQQ